MTSNINYAGIDANYPVAGQDNDTQGFRSNFGYIKNSLLAAKSEIEDLQAKAVLKGELTGGSPVDNNLGGGTIYNGFYNNLHGTVNPDSVSEQTDINVDAASVQVLALTANVNFTFKNWPGTLSDNKYAVVRVHLRSGNGGTHSATFYSENAGEFHCEPNVTTDPDQPTSVHPKIQVSANGKHKVLEFWSVTDGSDVYVRYLGEF